MGAAQGSGITSLGPPPNFGHACDFLSEYNYTEDFIGKASRLAHLSRTGKNCKGLKRKVIDFMHAFLHCLSSQNYIAIKRSYRCESTFFDQKSNDYIYAIPARCVIPWGDAPQFSITSTCTPRASVDFRILWPDRSLPRRRF